MTETREDRMMRRDGGLLRKVGDIIAAEPERYDQATWGREAQCGTVACLAGHTALLDERVSHLSLNGVGRVHLRDGTDAVTQIVARQALGLGLPEASQLFSGGWEPAGDPSTPLHERVQSALYALADGATVEEVSA